VGHSTPAREAASTSSADVDGAAHHRPSRRLRAVGVELTLGLLVDLSRGVSRAVADYQAGRRPEIKVGRQLGGSTIGIIGYGRISRALAPMLAALGVKVLGVRSLCPGR